MRLMFVNPCKPWVGGQKSTSLALGGGRPRKTQIVAIGRDIPIDTLEELFGSLVEEEIVA